MGAYNSQVSTKEDLASRFRNPVVEYATKTALKQNMTGANLARVLVIYCGGTIGMKKDPVIGYRPVKGYLTEYLKLSHRFHDSEYAASVEGHAPESYGINSMDMRLGDVLVLPVSMYGKRVAYQIYEYDTLKDSCNVNSKDWIGFAKDIEKYYHKYDSFIILHGTDTMAYTASALSFLLENLGKTVIITGSQIPFSELRNDAHENFLGALTLAGHYVIPEVTIFFDNRLLRGNRSRKVNAVDFCAFDSPNMKPLVEMGTSIDVDWPHILRPVVAPFKAWTKLNDLVGCFRLFPGISVEAVRALTAAPMRGIVLESFGAGNAPDDRPDLLQVIKEACDKGVIIVNVTQCTKGSAGQFYATGHAISQAGVISGLDMTAECALAKLNYLLSHEYDNATITRMLMEPLRGELTLPSVPMKEQNPQQNTLLGRIMNDAVIACPDANRDAVELTLRPLLLHQAAADGDIMALEEICGSNLHIDQVNHEHRTCLFAAICNGHLDTVRWLVDKGCNIHHRDKYNNTPLIYALICVHASNQMEERRVRIVTYLALETGSKIDSSALSNEVMHYAHEGNADMLELLYTIGTNMKCVDYGGRNILHIALANDHINVLRWAGTKKDLRELIEKKDKMKRSPLDEAVDMECGEKYAIVMRDALVALNPVKRQASSKVVPVKPVFQNDV